MKRELFTACVLASVLGCGGCYLGHPVGLTISPGDGGTTAGDGATAGDSCSTCSVNCKVLATGDGWDAVRDLQADSTTLYSVNATPNFVNIYGIGADDTLNMLVSNRRVDVGFDVAPSQLVWPESAGSSPWPVYTLPKAGGTPTYRVTIDLGSRAIADDLNLYFFPMGSTTLTAMPLAGGPPTTVATLSSSGSLVDVDVDSIYYRTAASSWRQPKTGGAAVPLAHAISASPSAADANNFYIFENASVVAVPRDGSPTRTLTTWQGTGDFYSAGIASDGQSVYFISPTCTNINMGCAIQSVPVTGGAATTLCSSIQTPIFIAANANGVYVVDGATLVRLRP